MTHPVRPPMPPFINPPIPSPHLLPPLGSAPQPRIYRNSATISSKPTVYQRAPEAVPQFKGPIITVFVGNISERTPETLLKRILSTCGSVVSWKRISTFGFCEYDGPNAGIRAVRLLSEIEIDGKKIVAKVDAKNKLLLDNYKEEEQMRGDYQEMLNEKNGDEAALSQMRQIINEHKHDFDDFNPNNRGDLYGHKNKIKVNRMDDSKVAKNLHDTSIEEEKRNLITSEIGKFRKKAEADEHRKEKEKKKLEEKEEIIEKNVKSDSDWDLDDDDINANLDKKKPMSPVNKEPDEDHQKDDNRRKRSKSRSKETGRDQSRRNRLSREFRGRERDRDREREKERDREKDREHERVKERDREEKSNKKMNDVQREKEMEEEIRERKKIEKKAQEKEEAYQERLMNWEARERRKSKEYEKIRNKENLKLEEREKEAKRLKEFLEDYDDEKDDIKYYRGRELQRRLTERVREADLDLKDRNKEQEELEDLKNKIFSGEYDDPTQEYEKAKKEHDNLYKPQILIDVNLENQQRKERDQERLKEKSQFMENNSNIDIQSIDYESKKITKRDFVEPMPNEDNSFYMGSNCNANGGKTNAREFMSYVNRHDSDTEKCSTYQNFSNLATHEPISANSIPTTFISLNLGGSSKKKKIESTSIFSNDEEGEDIGNLKKRKLIPLDYDDQKMSNSMNKVLALSRNVSHCVLNDPKPTQSSEKSNTNEETISSTSKNKKEENFAKSQDEKRRHIKCIIDRIPTQKEDLFNYKLDRNEIDNTLMERKIRPWINKKIIEYIGEPEPTLVDFICSKVLAGSSPQSILDDVQMVLDEEAEVFVVKMWRLLIYEVDAKIIGLGK